jgi:PKD repeat protein
MKKLALGILMLGAMMFIASGVSADVIVNDDFDDYNYTEGHDLYDEMAFWGWEIYDYTHPYDDDDVFLSYNHQSPEGDYYVVIRDDSWIILDVDTRGYKNVELEYYRRTYSAESGDYLRVYYKIGDGSWTKLEDVQGNTWTHKSWHKSGFDDAESVQFKFKLDNGNSDYALVDAVKVTGDKIPCEITVIMPEVGNYYNDAIPIEWELDGYCSSPTYNLHYKEGSCDMFPINEWHEITDTVYPFEYDWNSGIDEGEYCVRVSEDEGDDFGIMENTFYIDNIDPDADASCEELDPCDPCYEEDHCEDGVYQCYEGETITLTAEGSTDNYGIESYEWDLDNDGEYDDDTGVHVDYYCEDGDSMETVHVRVTDLAGNTDHDHAYVNVMNVDPVCEGIDGPTDVAVGFPVEFSGMATDVPADIPLEYDWDFDDGGYAMGNPVSHTFDESGVYEVTLTVSDGDGGYDYCYRMIDVVEPYVLDSQEVAAYYPLVANFGEDAGSNWEGRGSFMTGLEGMEYKDCEVIIGPDNLVSASAVDGECVVLWDNDELPHPMLSANPTNDQQGTHSVLVRVSNSEDEYEYYTFDVTVWSWIIDLSEGWNLVSIPYIPEDTSVEDVILDRIYDSLPEEGYSVFSYQYDPCEDCGDMSRWLKTDRERMGDLESVVPGHGYWIKVTEATKLKGMGTQLGQTADLPGTPPEVEVPTNSWALIGRYGILGTVPEYGCYDAGSIPVHTALDSVKKIDNELHVYDVDSMGHLVDVYRMHNNAGYWLWIEDNALNNAGYESYAPLDRFYREDLMCGDGPSIKPPVVIELN